MFISPSFYFEIVWAHRLFRYCFLVSKVSYKVQQFWSHFCRAFLQCQFHWALRARTPTHFKYYTQVMWFFFISLRVCFNMDVSESDWIRFKCMVQFAWIVPLGGMDPHSPKVITFDVVALIPRSDLSYQRWIIYLVPPTRYCIPYGTSVFEHWSH